MQSLRKGARLGAHLLIVGLIEQDFWRHVEIAARPASEVKYSLLANGRPDEHSTVSTPSPSLCCAAFLSRQVSNLGIPARLAVKHMDYELGTHICSTSCRVQQWFPAVSSGISDVAPELMRRHDW